MSIADKLKTAAENQQRVYDAGYEKGEADGYNKGLSEAEPILQEKTITANGEYTADEGYDGLSKVTVAVESSGSSPTLAEFFAIRDGQALFQSLNISDDELRFIFSDPNIALNFTSLNGFFRDLKIMEVPELNTSNITNMSYMFYACTSLKKIPNFDTSKVTTMEYMFGNCAALISIPRFDTAKVTNMIRMFYGCQSLTEVPKLDTSIVTDMTYMFSNCGALLSIPELNCANVTKLTGVFQSCKKLVSASLLNTSNATDMSNLFQACNALTSVPPIDCSSAKNTYQMYSNCSVLSSVTVRNTQNVTNMGSMFANSTKLTTVSGLDMRSVTSNSGIFYLCKQLTTIEAKNIKTALQVGSGTSYGHLLTVDSLVNLCYELCDTGSSKTLTIGTANLEKLANVYVKTIDVTGEMRAEDDLIDEKLPFVRCESTDDGAMLITDYVYEKNWQLK